MDRFSENWINLKTKSRHEVSFLISYGLGLFIQFDLSTKIGAVKKQSKEKATV